MFLAVLAFLAAQAAQPAPPTPTPPYRISGLVSYGRAKCVAGAIFAVAPNLECGAKVNGTNQF